MHLLPHDESDLPPKNDPHWRDMLRTWEAEFFKGLEEKMSPDAVDACRIPIQKSIRCTLDWCLARSEPLWSTKEKLGDTAHLIRNFYEAVTCSIPGHPKLKPTKSLWRHVRLGSVLSTANPGELLQEIATSYVKELANTYIAQPWTHNTYLDWIFIEALVLTETLAFSHEILIRRLGWSYALYGTSWKAGAFRLAMKSISFALGWLLPGALLIWLGMFYPLAALICAAVYYGASIILLARFLIWQLRFRLREGMSPGEKLGGLMAQMGIAYETLGEELIHVPSVQKALATSRDKGAAWPSQVYIILDTVAAHSPSSWSRNFDREPL